MQNSVWAFASLQVSMCPHLCPNVPSMSPEGVPKLQILYLSTDTSLFMSWATLFIFAL